MKKPQCSCLAHQPCPCAGQNCQLCVSDPRHGSTNAYGNFQCRCESCRTVHAHQKDRLRDEWRYGRRVIPDHVHGTDNGYSNYCCRCAACRKAHTVTRNEQAHRASRGLTDVALGLAPAPKRRKKVAQRP